MGIVAIIIVFLIGKHLQYKENEEDKKNCTKFQMKYSNMIFQESQSEVLASNKLELVFRNEFSDNECDEIEVNKESRLLLCISDTFLLFF